MLPVYVPLKPHSSHMIKKLMYPFQAFQDLLSGPVPRLDPSETDVEPYVVDGTVYLARLSSPF